MRVQGRGGRSIECDDYDIESVNRALSRIALEVEILLWAESVARALR